MEDIDRVPFELLSSIASLLETNTLVMPGRGDPLPASPGFCLFGTRTVPGGRSAAVDASAAGAGDAASGVAVPVLQPLVQPLSVFEGLWSRVAVLPLTDPEVASVLTRSVGAEPLCSSICVWCRPRTIVHAARAAHALS